MQSNMMDFQEDFVILEEQMLKFYLNQFLRELLYLFLIMNMECFLFKFGLDFYIKVFHMLLKVHHKP
jgi:hypothetical protein